MKKTYYLGLDIGGTKCAASVGEVFDGKICIKERAETSTERSPIQTLEALDTKIRAYLKEYPIERAGISCGGPLDGQNGKILNPPNLPGWENFPITEYVSKKYGLTAKLENDANACAVAEWKFGAGVGTKNMLFLTFGTGLGVGLILDGRLYSGTNGNAGEVGHIRLADDGPIGYGKEGSFEGFCSGGGIRRLATAMAKKEKVPPAYMSESADGVTTKELSRYAFEGDDFARRVFLESGKMLGKGLSVLVDILNPERIVLGGVFMRSAELLLPAMEAELSREALAFSREVCEIVPAKLSENIGDVAAVAVAAYGV